MFRVCVFYCDCVQEITLDNDIRYINFTGLYNIRDEPLFKTILLF